MTGLKERRREQGLSQRKLAQKAGVAYKTVQLLESGGHDARSSTLAKLAKALRLEGPEELLSRRPPTPRATAAEAADAILRDGDDSWKLWLFEFVDAFRRSPSATLVARAPDPATGARLLAMLASTVEALCAEEGIPVPWWCAGVPSLPEPWFVAGMEGLKAAALAESPAAFRRRNIFVLGNFLSRA